MDRASSVISQTLKPDRAAGGRAADERWDESDADFCSIVTQAAGMLAMIERARCAAQSDAVVCLSGPSGAGKRLLARAIHRASRRAGGPFVAVRCSGALQGSLESELFGCSRGAFGAAARDRRGAFQAAARGTLLLDEVCELPPALQAKLVRALGEQRVQPVGSGGDVPIDVRLVCTTRRHIAQQVAIGALREDLAARLQEGSLTIPSLAERREDIALLAGHFLAQSSARRRGSAPRSISGEALHLLAAESWPGNVAQLRNVVLQAAAATSAQVLSGALVRQVLGMGDSSWEPLDEARKAFERSYLVHVLEITGGNVTRAARLAGRNRTEFYRLLERHALQPAMFKGTRPPH